MPASLGITRVRPRELSGPAAYRQSQLANTLRFVQENSPYYRELLRDRDLEPGQAEEALRSLPPLDLSAWSAARSQLRTGPLRGVTIGYAEGPAGQPTPFLSVQREVEALENALRDTDRSAEILVISGSNHCDAVSPTARADGRVVHPLYRQEHYRQVAALLEREIEPFSLMPRIDAIEADLVSMKALTLYLMHRRGRVDDLGITRISVSRNLLSRRWRIRLEDWWGAQVESVFGIAEMPMCDARSCADCGYFHMPPSCLVEVLNGDEDWEPVRPGGRGMLAVTGFHPFVELEPRIRYVPGEVAQLAPGVCHRWGERGFRPLGRSGDSARNTRTGAWVCPADVYSALADHVAVNRVPPTTAVEGRDQDEVSGPRFMLETGHPVRLHVELRFSPTVWEAEASTAERSIQKLLPEGVEVIAHEPGRLGTVVEY